LKYFLSFCGYPRSGHTLVAAILNANPNVVCSNQLNIYQGKNIDFKYIKEYSKRPETWKSSTQIPHVPKKEITVIGDKTGHRTIEILKSDPTILGKFKAKIDIPIKWIHVVRNPFDNLATWAKLNYENKIKNSKQTNIVKELNNVIEKYKALNDTISKLRMSEDVLTVNHEFVITRMHNTLEEISNFLEISFDPIWRDNVRNTVWKQPRTTRRQIPWDINQKRNVKSIINQYPWLNGYEYGGCGRC
jgi:hypothetical protein